MLSKQTAVKWQSRLQNFRLAIRRLSGRLLSATLLPWLAGVGTADLKVCGRLHYHSATACSDIGRPPHCLEPSLPLTKNPNCVFLSTCLLARMAV